MIRGYFMARRKSDAAKLEEGRGTGRKENYKPWIKVHEFGSKGRVHRIFGWKTNRIHHLLSDMELYAFLNIQFNDNVLDIREQFPLLPLENTILIADNYGIKHPSIKNKVGNEIVMTTDFVVTVRVGNVIRDIVRTIKFEDDLVKRNIDKFRIEKEFFKQKGITDWGIITENNINVKKARNLYYIYDSYFWDKQNHVSESDVNGITYDFLNILVRKSFNVTDTIEKFSDYMDWDNCEGLAFLKYLITHKKVLVDLNKSLDFKNMNVWIKE